MSKFTTVLSINTSKYLYIHICNLANKSIFKRKTEEKNIMYVTMAQTAKVNDKQDLVKLWIELYCRSNHVKW